MPYLAREDADRLDIEAFRFPKILRFPAPVPLTDAARLDVLHERAPYDYAVIARLITDAYERVHGPQR